MWQVQPNQGNYNRQTRHEKPRIQKRSSSEKLAQRIQRKAKKYAQVLVDLLLLAVLAQQTAQNAHAANPHDLGGEAGLCGTLALTSASVATLALLGEALVDAEAAVNRVRLANDVAILHELADVLA